MYFYRGKDSESRAQRKDENEVFDLNAAEAPPVLSKDRESREQSREGKRSFELNIAELHAVLWIGMERGVSSGSFLWLFVVNYY